MGIYNAVSTCSPTFTSMLTQQRPNLQILTRHSTSINLLAPMNILFQQSYFLTTGDSNKMVVSMIFHSISDPIHNAANLSPALRWWWRCRWLLLRARSSLRFKTVLVFPEGLLLSTSSGEPSIQASESSIMSPDGLYKHNLQKKSVILQWNIQKPERDNWI
jgi:hypothetical protein